MMATLASRCRPVAGRPTNAFDQYWTTPRFTGLDVVRLWEIVSVDIDQVLSGVTIQSTCSPLSIGTAVRGVECLVGFLTHCSIGPMRFAVWLLSATTPTSWRCAPVLGQPRIGDHTAFVVSQPQGRTTTTSRALMLSSELA
jgi:hypothetical protein